MPPPSTQLHQAIRATEYIRTSFPAVRQHQSQHRHPSHASFPWLTDHQSRSLPHASQTIRAFSATTNPLTPPSPKLPGRGPESSESTQTDFNSLNVLGSTPPPTTTIDACLSDGFHLDNGLKITGGSGCLLVSGDAFSWRPWLAGERSGTLERGRMINRKRQWDVAKEAWGLLDLLWPKPDLLILGLGPSTHPISSETRHHINSLGIRLDVQDTRNAAAQFNLLATERGVGNVAAALIPIGWKEPKI